MNKLIITFVLAALAFGAVADETGGTRGRGRRQPNPEAKLHRFSTTVEKERPKLNQETKDLIAAYRPVLGAQGRNVSIGATPVTEADWAKFAGTSVSPEKARLPVVGISVAKSNISYHLKNIFETGELERDRTVQKIRTVQYEGGRSVSRSTDFFNLEVVISLGFRINSRLGIQFRRWANDVLRQYMAYGIAVSNPQTNALVGESIPA